MQMETSSSFKRMCGITGILNSRGSPVASELLRTMIRTIRHRGPDESGIHTDGPLGFAHARLSIIDLAGGQQPMSNADQSLWITFNGEIFNYVELREELVSKGYQFATRSDTEVILNMYEEKGEDCVKFFNGQWAFAIWDKNRRKLFLSRDRIGVRPLFYTTTQGSFVFGSEIKSILSHPGVTREIDLEGLDQVFTYWCTLPPRTTFKNIHELPPGHSMSVRNGTISVWRYWQLQYAEPGKPSSDGLQTEEDYAEKLKDLLVDATRIRLRSDVPVGAYLSGGLDSTITTSLIRNFTQTSLKTFSVVFDDPEFDESSHQNEAVRYLDTDHQEVRCSNSDIARVFPDVIWHTERPILRTAPAPLFLLSQFVRSSNYKVVLTGEGADEMLGGYDIFKEMKIRRFLGAMPGSKLRPLLLKRLYPYLPNIQSQPEAYLKAFFHVNPEDLSNPFFSHLPRWNLTSKLKVFFSDEVKAAIPFSNGYGDFKNLLPEAYSRWDPFAQAQYLEASALLPGYILSSQGDRVAMAHSVEGRFPFLDYRVMEFASALPANLKMRVLNEKYLLKCCIGDLIPPSIRLRAKQPYRAPEGNSFFCGKTQDYVKELLSAERIEQDGLFNPAAVQLLVEKFRDNRAIGIKDNMALVGIVSTQILVDQYINRFPQRVS